jgi:hypothetical protein
LLIVTHLHGELIRTRYRCATALFSLRAHPSSLAVVVTASQLICPFRIIVGLDATAPKGKKSIFTRSEKRSLQPILKINSLPSDVTSSSFLERLSLSMTRFEAIRSLEEAHKNEMWRFFVLSSRARAFHFHSFSSFAFLTHTSAHPNANLLTHRMNYEC